MLWVVLDNLAVLNRFEYIVEIDLFLDHLLLGMLGDPNLFS